MSTIRDVVRALASRDGVEAVIVLGRDGLPIDAHASNGVDTEGVAALIPSIVAACNRLGSASGRGDFGTGVVEYARGLALVSVVAPEAILAILVDQDTNVGPLLFELRRHRSALAGLL